MDEMIGKLFTNNNGNEFKVISFSHRDEGGNKYYNIMFTETGYKISTWKYNILRGCVKDIYAKDVCGVACIGNAKARENWKEYQTWYDMIKRCYNPNFKHFQVYGGSGVYVCDEWLCFENFLKDIAKIDGYDKDMFYNGDIQLDKDKKSGGREKYYSLETCTFLGKSENSRLSKTRKKTKIIAKSPDGEIHFVEGVRRFCIENNLSEGNVYRCLKGERTHVKGWTFERNDG